MLNIYIHLPSLTFSPGDFLQGLIRIENRTNAITTISKLSLRFIAKILLNTNLLNPLNLGLSKKTSSHVMYRTPISPFISNISFMKDEQLLYHFGIQLPLHLPNSLKNETVKFLYTIELFSDELKNIRIIKIPLQIIAPSYQKLKIFKENEIINFSYISEIPLENEHFGSYNKSEKNSFLRRSISVEPPSSNCLSLTPVIDHTQDVFTAKVNGKTIASINPLKPYFYLDEQMVFKIDVLEPCVVWARLVCMHSVNPECRLNRKADDFSEKKLVMDEKVLNLEFANWAFLELYGRKESLPSSENRLGKIIWLLKLEFSLGGFFGKSEEGNSLAKDNKFVCDCYFPVYKSRKTCEPNTFEFNIVSV